MDRGWGLVGNFRLCVEQPMFVCFLVMNLDYTSRFSDLYAI
jgi:hypothetical protein